MSNFLYSVDDIKSRVAGVADKYGIGRAFLFGSYARGEATPQSDIDICIEKGQLRTLLELSGFYQDLEKTLQHKVDVVTMDGLDNNFKAEIKKEFVLIYE
ncbi:putative nucleotidyltransferases [Candidatus Termititenax aidoneus]|uniref:Nucleotidyltransferases n=1 Tax=Termititenax aidoneus TaxID=2218524 RepID=A0A388T9Z3_TERA1|nr:putative nucleotidyltransferases [Candidatus Termititenax aidoneus]